MFITLKRTYTRPWFQTDLKTYTAGGLDPNNSITSVDKASYNTEINAASAASSLVTSRAVFASCGSNAKGYIIGGVYLSGLTVTILSSGENTIYSTDITSTNASLSLPVATEDIEAFGNNLAVYSCGGSTIENKWDTNASYKTPFSTDTTATQTSANISTKRGDTITLNSLVAGMCMGGFNSASVFVKTNVADKMPFGTEVMSSNASMTLVNAVAEIQGICADLTKNGYVGSDDSFQNWMKVDYQTDVTSTTGISFPVPTAQDRPYEWSGHSSRYVGYTIAGRSANDVQFATAYKMPFATETISVISSMDRSLECTLSGGYG